MMTEFDMDYFSQLDIITEENPPLFLKNFASYENQITQPIAKNRLKFCKAKALVMLRQFGEAEMIAFEVLRQTGTQQNHFLLVQFNLILSKCFHRKNTIHRVKSYLDIAEGHAAASNNPELIAEVNSHLGIYYSEQEEDETSLEYFVKSVTMAKAFKPSLATANIFSRVASFYYHRNQFDKVIEYLNQALEISQKANIIFLQLRCFNNLATAYTNIKNYELASELLNKGIELCKRNDYPKQLIQLLFNLGVQYRFLNQCQKAIELYDQCFELANKQDLAEPAFLSDIYNNYAECHWQLGHSEETIHYMNLAEEIVNQFDNPALIHELRVNKTNILIGLGQFPEAKEILEEAIVYYQTHHDYKAMLLALRNLAFLYEKQEDLMESIKVHQRIETVYVDYIDHTLNERAKHHTQQIKELTDKYDQIYVNYNSLAKSYQNKLISGFVGQSKAHKKVLNSALLAAKHPNTHVLIMGEPGTGKEMIASIIHHNSVRRDSSFVSFNALDLIEGNSKLKMSQVKHNDSKNLTDFFIQAQKGTLFVKEITAIPNQMQVQLLRMIESKKMKTDGSSEAIPFDSRIISTSTKDIYELIRTSEFRLELFHHLNAIEIYIPPLRSRPEDIEMLIYYFIDKNMLESNRPKPQINNSFIDKLMKYPFPGNVQELKNLIEKLFIFTKDSVWNESTLESIREQKVVGSRL